MIELSMLRRRVRGRILGFLALILTANLVFAPNLAAVECALVEAWFGSTCGCSRPCYFIVCEDGTAAFLGCGPSICMVCV
jgi:hypothetical protein